MFRLHFSPLNVLLFIFSSPAFSSQLKEKEKKRRKWSQLRMASHERRESSFFGS
jgi:hypothetical protein